MTSRFNLARVLAVGLLLSSCVAYVGDEPPVPCIITTGETVLVCNGNACGYLPVCEVCQFPDDGVCWIDGRFPAECLVECPGVL